MSPEGEDTDGPFFEGPMYYDLREKEGQDMKRTSYREFQKKPLPTGRSPNIPTQDSRTIPLLLNRTA
ncbi:MAG TPA: hypothetical protein DIS59_03010 [Candidatus Magasanikbacteria bacterium]|nr:hypothetical protein [Candidatus Magasanikbacteria bacterium]